MYCIKCGKNSQSSEMLCETCKSGSGFWEVSRERLDKNRIYGMYLAFAGNLLIFLGLLCSFILIKPDAPADYVAEIFKEETMGPVETESTETPEDGNIEEDKQEVEMESKGFSFSVIEYLSRRIPSEDDEEDIAVLQMVMANMDSQGITRLDLNDEQQIEQVLGSYDETRKEEILDILEYYSKSNAGGIITIVIGMIALIAACWMVIRNDFRWSFIFTLIATVPIWNLLVKLNGITSWEFRYGMYIFVVGFFAVMVGVLLGGNTDVCPDCKEKLPGGSVFCWKCSYDISKKKEKKHYIHTCIKKNSVVVAVIGNIIMFLPVIVPVFSLYSNNKEKVYMSIMGMRGLQSVQEMGMPGILLLTLIVGLVFMIAAVVTSIFEKNIISGGCSLTACTAIVLAIYMVQKTVDLATLFTLVLIPAGLGLALAGNLNGQIQFKEWKRKVTVEETQKEAIVTESSEQ